MIKKKSKDIESVKNKIKVLATKKFNKTKMNNHNKFLLWVNWLIDNLANNLIKIRINPAFYNPIPFYVLLLTYFFMNI